MGRPTKLTPDTQARIVESLSHGSTRIDAAVVAGIDYKTFRGWVTRGKKEQSGIYRDFVLSLTRAESFAADEYAKLVRKGANEDWRAAAWWLERKRRKQFGKTDKLEYTGKGGGPILIHCVEVVKPDEPTGGSET